MVTRVLEKMHNTPLQIVILGGTGDLANRKLIPALLDLFVKKKLPKKFSIIGLARTEFTTNEYRAFVQKSITGHKHAHSQKDIELFCKHIQYVIGSFSDASAFTDIKATLATFDERVGMCTNKIYYLAIPPVHYETVFGMLHKHKMHLVCDPKLGWARVLVEKPFGSNFDTARKLDKRLGSLFMEEQIYRIDHYLAKEAAQNILSFRFANTLLRGSWNKEHIDKISITMLEKVGLEGRGAFYDEIGALRDVGQNHLLQLLALLTMEEPKEFNVKQIHKQRAAILKQLKPHTKKSIKAGFLRAQYSSYKNIKGVAKKSATETFFELHTELNDPAWKGVPILLKAGKGLSEAKVEIEIILKNVSTGPFLTDSCRALPNCVKLTISPKQTMQITLNAKAPGLKYRLEPRTLVFDCPTADTEVTNSYEKVLLDCIVGDQTLFMTTEEVLSQWKYINSVLKYMHTVPLQTYKQGSAGPKHKLFDVI
ncbi:MAG: glucose-6-phosphate 1-dehydrogenase [Candidatus Azotimanducaceae bacterium]|jgi:glucose-6-phosphate 1-dehydrogenase